MPRTLIGSTTDTRARKIASEWHGGQSSPLYALASTGSILDGISSEIVNNLCDYSDMVDPEVFESAPQWRKDNYSDLSYLASVVGPIVESWEEDQEAIEEAKVRHPSYSEEW